MRGFTLIWFGQFISMLGSGMTGFAISFWLFAETGQAATLTWAIFFFMAPSVLLSPLAGALVDRTSRKNIMILSDLAAGLVTIALLILFATDSIHIWHLYLGNFISGAFNSFQFPAYSAAVTLMLPKEQYGRASGMIGLAGSASNIMAPAFAGAMLGWVGIEGIMLVDVVTFVVAIATLFVVHIPQPQAKEDGRSTPPNSLWQDSLFGFRYIWARPSLLGMQLIFFATNLLAMVGIVLMVPMILARTQNNEITLASVQSISAIGGVIGGLLMSTWGGPKHKVHGVLIGMILTGLLGQALMGIGQGLFIWATAAFASQLIIPILNGSNQAIWQTKVPPEIQGRVFSVRRLIAQITAPLATAITGPLADKIFEPAMAVGTPLAQSLHWLIPSGPGAGMALLMVISGILAAGVGAMGYAVTAVRHIETLIPDHDTDIIA
ncbi:MAG: MFS transporter [Ardenticatenaceae bacterium]|nr:MFS transporter [Ardenticatenaceae bacterium]